MRFHVYLKDKYKVKKAFLFIGFIPKNKELYNYLAKAGYILVYKPVVESKRYTKPKGNIDAELVLHTMIEFSHYDKAIIVSGDGDFHCLVEYLNKKRKYQKLSCQIKNIPHFLENSEVILFMLKILGIK